jgi:hypothetical protein
MQNKKHLYNDYLMLTYVCTSCCAKTTPPLWAKYLTISNITINGRYFTRMFSSWSQSLCLRLTRGFVHFARQIPATHTDDFVDGLRHHNFTHINN